MADPNAPTALFEVPSSNVAGDTGRPSRASAGMLPTPYSVHAVVVTQPELGLQLDGWQPSTATHVLGEPTHTPAWQISVSVHALLSLQLVPFGAAGFEHMPVAGSQLPTAWHGSRAIQVTD